MSEFCCPKCGSSYWGTVKGTPCVGHCHRSGCDFQWNRDEFADRKLGIKHPREARIVELEAALSGLVDAEAAVRAEHAAPVGYDRGDVERRDKSIAAVEAAEQEALRVNQAQLDEWKRLASEATPGPWTAKFRAVTTWEIEAATDVGGPGGWGQCDAQFVCAAREAVPALIAEVERLRGTECDRAWRVTDSIEALERAAHSRMIDAKEAELAKTLIAELRGALDTAEAERLTLARALVEEYGHPALAGECPDDVLSIARRIVAEADGKAGT